MEICSHINARTSRADGETNTPPDDAPIEPTLFSRCDVGELVCFFDHSRHQPRPHRHSTRFSPCRLVRFCIRVGCSRRLPLLALQDLRSQILNKTNSSIRMPSILMLMTTIMVPIIIVILITRLRQSMEQTCIIQAWGQLKMICRIWNLSTLTLRRHGVHSCPLTRIRIKHRRDSWVHQKI